MEPGKESIFVNFAILVVQGELYLQFIVKGDIKKGLIVNYWSKICEMDLERIYTADFEVFGEKAQNPTDAEIDFLVAVK